MYHMKKRLVSLLLAFSMMLSILPLGAFADYSTLRLEMEENALGYSYPVGSNYGKQDAAGDGWSYTASNETLTLDSPGNTFRIESKTIFLNVVVNKDTTLYGLQTRLCRHTTNYGTIRAADFYLPQDYSGSEPAPTVDNYGRLLNTYFAWESTVNNHSTGEIDLYVDRTSAGLGNKRTSDFWSKHLTNEAGGIVSYAWLRWPVTNYGTLTNCQLSFDKENGSTTLNDGTIEYSTIFASGDSGYTSYITGSGTIDHSHIKYLKGEVDNTITNTVIETNNCDFAYPSDMHTISSSANFVLKTLDGMESASTFRGVTSVGFIGSPQVYVYSNYSSDNILSINGYTPVVGNPSTIPGLASLDGIGTESYNCNAYTFTPDGTKDITLSSITGIDPGQPRTPTADDFDYKAPILNTDMVDDLADRLLENITVKNGIDKKDVTLILCDADGNQLDAAPTKVGKYTFKLSVKAAKDGSYTATPQPLTSDSWKFSIFTAGYGITVEGGQAYVLNGDKKLWLSSETLVPPDTVVYLEPDAEHADTSDFYGWYDAADTTKTPILSSFVMPHHDVTLKLLTAVPDPTPDVPDDSDPDAPPSASSALGTAVAVTAFGAVSYAVVTRIWLETILPKDTKIPTNRQQLADLLWEQAGKPEPQSTALFADIAADASETQKAARWCVEQGLISANGDKFTPKGYTFRAQVIKAWNQLQKTLNAEQ